MERRINIQVLNKFKFSRGDVYSIKFPTKIIPKNGMRLLYQNRSFSIKAVALSSSGENNIMQNIINENVWDCILMPELDLTEIPIGDHEIFLYES